MFVCNFKLNKNIISKIFLITICLIVLILLILSVYKIFYNGSILKINDELPNSNVINIDSNNYTNVLKSVHDNLDTYINKQISFTGYVYRVYDFDDTQFVLARDMVISSDMQTLVVGFLCKYKNASNFTDGTWVNITGTIKKGDYHGDIPIIEINEMKKCEKPNSFYVYPPDDTFIPTSAIY